MTTLRLLAAAFALALAVPTLASDVSSDRHLRAGPSSTVALSIHGTPTTTDEARALAAQTPATCACPRG